jgi:NAD(P)-dependent dehydrogenase (short-subunit alcohol dehydrogenase family)
MSNKVALVTNVTQYAGPAGAAALAAEGYRTVCHDYTFTDDAVREGFATANPGLLPVAEQDPEALVAAADAEGVLEAVVSNDWVPPSAVAAPLEEASTEDFDFIMRELVYRPFRLIQASAPVLRAHGGGRIILMTSAVARRQLGYAVVYSAARAASTAMMTAAAKALGGSNIVLNAIGPNYFENPTYFPPGRWEQDAALRAEVAEVVPLQRLGKEEEMGALIAFLASGRAAPVTGQFFGFTGGWLP